MSLLNWSRLNLRSISRPSQVMWKNVEIENSPSLASYRFGRLCSIYVYCPTLVSPDGTAFHGRCAGIGGKGSLGFSRARSRSHSHYDKYGNWRKSRIHREYSG